MKLIESIAASSWVAGFKHVTCARTDCSRWLTQRHLEARKVGVSFSENWYCSYKCLAAVIERAFGKMVGPTGSKAKHTFRMPLGLTLVSRGYLSADQLRAANEYQKERGGEIGNVLLHLGYVDEKQLTAVRAAQWGCPVYEAAGRVPSASLKLPHSMVKRYMMIPLEHNAKLRRCSVGFVDGIDYGALYALEQITGCKAQPYLVTATEFQHHFQFHARLNGGQVQVFDSRHSPAEMRHILCSFGAEMDAEEVSVARCGDYVWARLVRGSETADLLFCVV